jgi:hypothetical protein
MPGNGTNRTSDNVCFSAVSGNRDGCRALIYECTRQLIAPCRHAAIDHDFGAGDETRFVGGALSAQAPTPHDGLCPAYWDPVWGTVPVQQR